MCDYDKYRKVVSFQNLMMDHELSFKSNATYREILEHTTLFDGSAYLAQIQSEFGTFYQKHKHQLIDLCTMNDIYGKPMKEVIGGVYTSPSNFRYIYHSLLIVNNMVLQKLNDVNVIEIGGGYGGLCFFLHHIATLLGIRIASYTIFDIKEVTILQKRYLSLLGLDIQTYHIDDKWSLHEKSYLISNYAFSEIPSNLQQDYCKKILNKYVSYGFLVWNFIPFYPFLENKKFRFEKERPAGDDMNKFVYVSLPDET